VVWGVSNYHLRKQDEIIREELRTYMQDNYHDSTDALKKVVEWNPYDQNATAEWFDPALMFGLQKTNRFDIVIGNPPYRQIQKLPTDQKNAYAKEDFRSYAGSGDIYLLFYERGLALLKNSGYLSYITSNKWMRAAYGESFRNLLTGETVHELLDFGDHQFFDNATTYVNIALIQHGKPDDSHKPRVNDLSRSYERDKTLRENLDAQVDYEPMFEPTSYVIARPAERRLKEKIETAGKPLGQWDVRINYGIKTGLNEAFVIDGARRAELIAADPKSEEIIVPLVRGKDIKRYRVDWKDLWLINAHNGVKKQGISRVNVPKHYPAVYEHLKQFRPAIEKRQDQGDHWTNLRNCAYLADFRIPRVVWMEISPVPNFALEATPDRVILNTAYMMVGSNIESIFPALNSRITQFFVEMSSPLFNGKNYRFTDQYVQQIPVPAMDAPHREMARQFNSQMDAIVNDPGFLIDYETDGYSICSFGLDSEDIDLIIDKYDLDRERLMSIVHRYKEQSSQ
jgi:hypothetical protein